MEEVVGGHIPSLFRCFYSHPANGQRPTARRFLERKELMSQAWRKREERLVQVGNIDDSNVLDDNSVIEA
jgi:hypothetical protein